MTILHQLRETCGICNAVEHLILLLAHYHIVQEVCDETVKINSVFVADPQLLLVHAKILVVVNQEFDCELGW